MSGNGPAGGNPEGTRPAADDLRGHASILADLDPGFKDSTTETPEEEPRRHRPPSNLSGRPDVEAPPETPAKAEPEERDDNALDIEDFSVLFGDEPAETDKHPRRSDSEAFELDLPDGSKLTSSELKKLRDSGLRLDDYTRKTKELAENRKGLETRFAGLEQQEQNLTQRFQQIMFILQNKLPPEPNPELSFTQPNVYNQQKAMRDAAIYEIQKLNDIYFGHQKQREETLAAANREYARSEAQQLKEFFPQLSDKERASRFVEEISKGVEFYGFTPNDVNATMDHRIWRMAADAIMYRKLVEKSKRPNRDRQSGQFVAKAEASRGQTVRPQARVSQAQIRSATFKRDRESLARTGSLTDAARVIHALDKET